MIKTAILGCGFMGRTHAETLINIDGVKLTSLCGKNLDSPEKLRSELGLDCKVYDDFDLMLKETGPDAVFICIPPSAHSGQAELAAQAGAHLFLEKPLALDIDRAKRIVDAASKAGIITQVGYHMRHGKAVRKLCEMISAGTAGTPVQFTGRYWTRMDGAPWWRDREKSGGQIFEQLIHIYNLASMLMGEVRSAHGYIENLCHKDREDYTIEDSSLGVLRHKNGALSSVSGTNCAVDMHFFGDFRAVFENATLEYRSTGQPWVKPDSSVIYHADGTEENFVENARLYEREVLDFIEAIHEGGPAGCPAETGLEDLITIQKIIDSTGSAE